ncbi:response regulator [Pseudogulbenkiania sp. MAI-1]|uniref:hybrid sensor histidine kinase/response regulator n=1 Tax=Pseudogulbenkiania sp. MAI-1 TaxID=990370 RepID=UPI00045E6B5A|nr:response regulator [Pseudogulbenkiania sp. MAI-1]
MAIDREALRQRLLSSFREEAAERLAVLEHELLRWQQAPPQQESIETVFREVHSLKGAARAVGLTELERLSHAWETLLSALKRGQLEFQPPLTEISRDVLRLLQRAHAGESLAEAQYGELCRALEAVAAGEQPAPRIMVPPLPGMPASAPVEPPPPARGDSVRVPVQLFDAFLYHGEALTQSKLEAQALRQQLRAMQQDFQTLKQRRTSLAPLLRLLRENLADGAAPRPDTLHGLLDYLDWNQDQLDRLHFNSNQQARAGTHLAAGLAGLADGFAQGLHEVLQMPCQALLDGLLPVVDDLARQTGKRVRLQLPDTALQVDKRILDDLRTPLHHLVRNAIDHGIETPAARLAAGKAESGTLTVEIQQESGSHFLLRLRDDGGGIDAEQVKAKAVELGLLAASEAGLLDETQALSYIFESGLSTSRLLTDLSGRGLGLAIVREAVEKLGGRIGVQSRPGRGCEFSLRLPLSRSSFRAVLVRVAERLFGMPAQAVERTLRLPRSAVRRVENKATVSVDGQVLPLWSLAEVLGLPAAEEDGRDLHLLLVGTEGIRHVLQVDELLGDQEITLKSLGAQLKRVRNLLGATVLGDGTLVPVLHPQDLQRSALSCAGAAFASNLPERRRERQRILVAEDSFTSRGLLKALLETAGYEVQTANDGLDAWNALKQGQFDLLVSDIEMPRLDGFALTSKIRADRTLAELPVVLVTALQSAEDRAHGLDVGANAYLVKSGLEQDTLLDAVKRLL